MVAQRAAPAAPGLLGPSAVCDWREHGVLLETLTALAADPAAECADARVVLRALATVLPDTDCAALLRAHARAIARRCTPLAYPATPRARRDRLRLGYAIDPLGAPHAAAQALDLLQAHRRDTVEVFAYLLDGDAAAFAPLAATADVARPAVHLAAHELAGLLRVDDIDVLIDAAGPACTKARELGLHRPARAVLDLYGPTLDAAGPAAPLCMPSGAAPAGAAADPALLCACAEPDEIDPAGFALWMNVLRACPGTRLLIADGPPALHDNLRAATAADGIDPARLAFAAPAVQTMETACLYLDTLAGGSELLGRALAAGLPVLTLAATRLGMRRGAATLAAAGLDAFVCASPGQLAGMVASLLGAPARLNDARARFAAAFVAGAAARRAACAAQVETRARAAYERDSLASANGV